MENNRDVDGLLKALHYKDDPHIRRSAAKALGRIGDTRAVDPLISTFTSSEDFHVRMAAIRAVGRIGDPRAVNPLLGEFDTAHKDESTCVIDAITTIGGPAVEPLISALNAGKKERRIGAITALGTIKESNARPPLFAALQDPDADIRRCAAEALDVQGLKPDHGSDGAWYAIAKKDWQSCVTVGSPAADPLIALLKNSDDDMVVAAASALGDIKDPRAVDPLIVLLAHPYGKRRESATRALEKIGRPAVDSLILALDTVDRDVLKAAAIVLGNIGDSRAIAPLIPLLKNEDLEVRDAAAVALNNLHWKPPLQEDGTHYAIAKRDWQACVALGSPAIYPLIAVLKNKDYKMVVDAVSALGEIKDPRAVEPLIGLLRHPDGHVRERAGRSLEKIGAPAVESLLFRLQDDDWSVVRTSMTLLSNIRDPRAIAPLILFLRQNTMARKEIAAEALRRMNWQPDSQENEAWYRIARKEWGTCIQIGSSAVLPLIATINTSDWKIRKAAAETLVKIYNAGHLDPETKNQILGMKTVITQSHTDTISGSMSDCVSRDHTDSGIGVPF